VSSPSPQLKELSSTRTWFLPFLLPMTALSATKCAATLDADVSTLQVLGLGQPKNLFVLADCTPFPVTVLTVPVIVTRRTVWLSESATSMLCPCPSPGPLGG
jgi:hypothetical protein